MRSHNLNRFHLQAWVVVMAALAACGCSGTTREEPGHTEGGLSVDPETGVAFVDIARESGLTLFTACGNEHKEHLLESTGTGVAVADYDGDGDEDLYIATAQTTDEWMAGRRPRANALYRNDGDGSFTDVAEQAGVDLKAWSCGTYFADYDNDGDKDLFVTTWGPNVLYRNNGDGTFTDITESAGVAGLPDGWSTSAAFGDLDADGDLDLYVANYCVYDLWNPPFGKGATSIWKGIEAYPGPRGFVGQPDELYRNNGDGTFTDITREAGIDDFDNPLYGLGVVMSDLDRDSDLDIYVANDSVANYLWRNNGDLRFKDVGALANVATNEDAREQAGMGTDAADFDGDGLPDLIVTNFSHEWNTLHRNRGGMFFSDATFEAGMKDSYLMLVWGTKFFDYDNDGWLDVVVANGHIYPEVDDHPHLNTTYRQTNSLYHNRGRGLFEDRTADSGPGFAIVESTRGLAVTDLDRDGDIDLVFTNNDAPANLLRNEGGNRLPWVAFDLVGTESNRDAVGAVLTLEAAGRRHVREVNPFGSYQSQSSYTVHFGLGEAEKVDRLVVRWPSGASEEFVDLAARRFFTIIEGEGVPVEEEAPQPAPAVTVARRTESRRPTLSSADAEAARARSENRRRKAQAALSPAARDRLARSFDLYGRGDFRSALEEAERALADSPAAPDPYRLVSKIYTDMGHDRNGIEFFRRTANRYRDQPHPWYFKGFHEYHLHLWSEALESFERAAALDPEDPEPYLRQGLILMYMGDFLRAQRELRTAHELDPASGYYASRFANALRVTGGYDEAERVLETSLSIAPDSADLHYANAQLRLRRGLDEEARQSLRRAIELQPSMARAHKDLAGLLFRAGLEDQAQRELLVAERLMDFVRRKSFMMKRVGVNPGNALLPLLMAELELTEGNFTDALAWFQRAKMLGAPADRIAAGRSEALFGVGNIEAGEAELSSITRTDDGRADLAWATLRVEQNRIQEAVARLDRAVSVGPQERDFLRRAADLYYRVGREAESNAMLERATAVSRVALP